MERLTNIGSNGEIWITDNDETRRNGRKESAYKKLAKYEDLEERLNGVSVKQVVDGFIKTVENQTNEEYEHGRILTNEEADEWNEYKQLDEQGLLLRLPCKAGDMVYLICSRYSECSKYKERLDEYNCQGCEEDECDSHKEYYIHINHSVSIGWIVRNLNDFGKTVFITQAEAEQKLKEMESD